MPKVAKSSRARPKSVTRDPSDGPPQHPIDWWRERLVIEPEAERAKREGREILAMAAEAAASARSGKDRDVIVAMVMQAAALARRSEAADEALHELYLASARYVAMHEGRAESGLPNLPPLRGARGGAVRKARVRMLLEWSEQARESVRARCSDGETGDGRPAVEELAGGVVRRVYKPGDAGYVRAFAGVLAGALIARVHQLGLAMTRQTDPALERALENALLATVRGRSARVVACCALRAAGVSEQDADNWTRDR